MVAINISVATRQFLLSRPEFISDVLMGSDEKAKKRVGMMLEKNLYDLPSEFLTKLDNCSGE